MSISGLSKSVRQKHQMLVSVTGSVLLIFELLVSFNTTYTVYMFEVVPNFTLICCQSLSVMISELMKLVDFYITLCFLCHTYWGEECCTFIWIWCDVLCCLLNASMIVCHAVHRHRTDTTSWCVAILHAGKYYMAVVHKRWPHILWVIAGPFSFVFQNNEPHRTFYMIW